MKKVVFILLLSCWAWACILQKSTHRTSIFTDLRDGQKYPYIKIGNDYWMTENMRYNVSGSMYNSNNPDSTYGRLYNWYQAMEACPESEGWRVASTYDWMSIEELLLDSTSRDDLFTMGEFRGKGVHIFKSKKGWNPPGTDSLGLGLLPAGRAKKDGFYYMGELAFFWTSNTYIQSGGFVDEVAEFRAIEEGKDGIVYDKHFKEDHYYSCRCTKSVPKEER